MLWRISRYKLKVFKFNVRLSYLQGISLKKNVCVKKKEESAVSAGNIAILGPWIRAPFLSYLSDGGTVYFYRLIIFERLFGPTNAYVWVFWPRLTQNVRPISAIIQILILFYWCHLRFLSFQLSHSHSPAFLWGCRIFFLSCVLICPSKGFYFYFRFVRQCFNLCTSFIWKYGEHSRKVVHSSSVCVFLHLFRIMVEMFGFCLKI